MVCDHVSPTASSHQQGSVSSKRSIRDTVAAAMFKRIWKKNIDLQRPESPYIFEKVSPI